MVKMKSCQSNEINVSIIIPVYNVENYLRRCLDSVINQTLKDIEIICVDDGSTDNSGKILDEYALKDKRIKVIHQRNKGAAVARNVGLSLAVGDYISILDSDDVFDKNMLQLLYNRAVSTGADITICRCQELDAQTGAIVPANYTLNHVPNKDVFNRKDLGSYVFEFTIGWSCDKLYKRNFLKDLNIKFQNLRSTNDAYFVFMTVCLANKITCIDNILITHRTNLMTSLSMTRDKDPFCFLTACNKIRHKLIKKDMWKDLKQSYINWFVGFCFWHLDTLKDENIVKDKIKEINYGII